MKRIDIKAVSLKTASLQAYSQGYSVVRNSTRSWTKAGCPILDDDLKKFAFDVMNKMNLFHHLHTAVIIQINKVNSYKQKTGVLKRGRRVGRCKLKKEIQIRDAETHEILDRAYLKKDAITKARKIIRRYKRDLYGKAVYNTLDVDFTLTYEPEKLNHYVIFYVEQEDVDLVRTLRRRL